jgi:hypothetical protein
LKTLYSEKVASFCVRAYQKVAKDKSMGKMVFTEEGERGRKIEKKEVEGKCTIHCFNCLPI